MAIGVNRRRANLKLYALVGFLLGTTVGLAVTGRLGIFLLRTQETSNPAAANTEYVTCGGRHLVAARGTPNLREPRSGSGSGDSSQDRNLIFVGVMTAQKYLWTRALAVHRTWAGDIPGRVVFFAGESATAPPGLPVVRLPGVDDVYPPQKKSFMMLKYMYEHVLDDFEWFMRTDDDVMIRPDRLESFLRSVNSSRMWFVGQAGTGNKEETGLLSLEGDENFCMGGPGVVMSREILRRVAPNVRQCLKNLLSTHEDVEVGRCVRRFAGVPCTWSYEMQTIFYHNSSGSEAFTGQLKQKEVHRAITMHPVKHHDHLYRLHSYLQSLRVQELQHQALILYRDIHSMVDVIRDLYMGDKDDKEAAVEEAVRALGPWERHGRSPCLNRALPRISQEITPWEFFQRTIYSSKNANPRRRIEKSLKFALDDVVTQVMDMINRFAKQRGRVIDFKEIHYGYRRVQPPFGTDYILDLLLVYKRYRGHKLTLPVRKHAYLQQSFTGLQVEEDDGSDEDPLVQMVADIAKRANTKNPKDFETNSNSQMVKAALPKGLFAMVQRHFGLVEQQQPSTSVTISHHQAATSDQPATIYFVLPLSGRVSTFQRFLQNYERVSIRQDGHTELAVVLFSAKEDEREAKEVERALEDSRRRYPRSVFEIVRADGPFSRAKALELGALHLGSKDFGSTAAKDFSPLLFFVDVDMYFSASVLGRIRENTIRGRRVYFPIVFSQYDPRISGSQILGRSSNVAQFRDLSAEQLDLEVGYWRLFGFGIASLYREDLVLAGGMNTKIEGWGLEDVDLFDRFVYSGHVVPFRAVDPGLVHLFHNITCDRSLPTPQMDMCVRSKATSLASQRHLSEIIYRNPDLLGVKDPAVEQKRR